VKISFLMNWENPLVSCSSRNVSRMLNAIQLLPLSHEDLVAEDEGAEAGGHDASPSIGALRASWSAASR
jgi:hypothetical protein